VVMVVGELTSKFFARTRNEFDIVPVVMCSAAWINKLGEIPYTSCSEFRSKPKRCQTGFEVMA
jgi:hypothetical protein